MGQQPMGQQPVGQQPVGQQPMGQQPFAGLQQPSSQLVDPQTNGQAPADGRCTDKETCLQIVDAFLDSQPRAFGLLQVRSEKELGGGTCGGDCNLPGACPEGPAKCRYDTYDSAMAAIYYVKRGKVDKAKEILDAFVTLLYPVNPATFNPPKP